LNITYLFKKSELLIFWNHLNNNIVIDIYTDGSYNPKFRIGAWVSLIFIQDKKILINGSESITTHNRMELLSAIKAIDYLIEKSILFHKIRIYSDSQYLVNLADRRIKLNNNSFHTQKGKIIQNYDLVKKILDFENSINIEFIKVPAHKKNCSGNNYNVVVDKLSRKIVRQCIKNLINKKGE
jgi:ribonuclease HI